ncbi:Bin/amphiphysin/Rvs domain for vesicular trafficking-domain-containing protein [Spinellus fusiger]|nr:Bin/amphiphysin/Rvs domain for vesicular trafficking-domain-containing protein [Spinellus fusiger]
MSEPTLRVVDALPENDAANRAAANRNPNVILNNAVDGFVNFGSKLNPFAQRLNKGIGQVRQYAQEKLGTAEDITELPQEYKDLERRVDALRNVQVNLLKVTRTYANPSYDYPVQIQESLLGITNTVTSQFQALAISAAERATTTDAKQPVEPPKTLSHAIGRIAAEGSQAVGAQEPLGMALETLSIVSEQVGNARLVMDQTIVSKFNQPTQTTLNTLIEQALKARRNVQSVRLSLDACKGRYRAARPERSEAAHLDVEQAEDLFVAAVEEATSLMKAALEDPEPFRHLADLVAAQVAYHKQAHDALVKIAPELDELQVTQESLYRNSRN